MSEYLLSVEPYVSSFGTDAKFNKDMLQKDDLMIPKSLIQAGEPILMLNHDTLYL